MPEVVFFVKNSVGCPVGAGVGVGVGRGKVAERVWVVAPA